MNEITVFQNKEFGEIRTIEINGEPWFVGKDVAEILGYSNASKAVLAHVDSEDRHYVMLDITDSQNGNVPIGQTKTTIINESGLYSLIISSKLPSAKKFKHWVTSEVLPEIRKHGSYNPNGYEYSATDIQQMFIADPLRFAITALTALDEEREKNKELETKIAEDKPKVEFAEYVAKNSDTIDIGSLAKLAHSEHINIGRNKLFEYLRTKKIFMRNNQPYQRYIDSGYFDVKEIPFNTSYGKKTYLKTVVTGLGQIFVIEMLRNDFGQT